MPYFHPHRFRKTQARLGEQICRTPEEFKAWSQNLGHKKVRTTFSSYGDETPNRQGEIIHALGQPVPAQDDALAMIRKIVYRPAAGDGVSI